MQFEQEIIYLFLISYIIVFSSVIIFVRTCMFLYLQCCAVKNSNEFVSIIKEITSIVKQQSINRITT